MTMLEQVSVAPIKRAAIALTDTAQLVALVTDKRIRVIYVYLAAAVTVTVKFQSGTGGGASDLTGAMTLLAGTGHEMGPVYEGLFQTVAGERLAAVLGAAQAVGGFLLYQEVA